MYAVVVVLVVAVVVVVVVALIETLQQNYELLSDTRATSYSGNQLHRQPVTQATSYTRGISTGNASTGNLLYKQPAIPAISVIQTPNVSFYFLYSSAPPFHNLHSSSHSEFYSTSTMTTKEESKPASAASPCAESQALAELNQRSARLGVWEVGIFCPHIHEWKWTDKKSQSEKSGAEFRCILVSVRDASQYVIAHINMRSDNREPLKKAETKFKADLKFRISKVALGSSVKQEYLHTPIKLKIDLAKTTVEALLQQKQGETVQACPSMSIKDCKKLQQTQRFDVTALMDELAEVRSVNATRQVISVTIIDDSGDDGKPGQLTFAFFMNLPLNKADAATMDILQQAKASKLKQVFSFFALQGKKTDKGYSFEADSKKEFFIVKAVGSKAERLTQDAESLQAVPKENRDVLQQTCRDYENEPGTQTLCKLLSDLSVTTDIQKLNEKTTLWQANWVEVGWPEGDTLLKKDGSQLWFQTSLRDLSGQVVNAWMNEKSALSLSGLTDKEAFIESFTEGNQIFPIMSTVKVTREIKSSKDDSNVSQSADDKTSQKFVNLVIVHAADQPWSEAPTKAALEMIPLLPDLQDDTSCILPAALHMVETSPQYAFTVACTSISDNKKIFLPCQKVLALVRSSKNSKPSVLGNGFKLITPGVEDLLSTLDSDGLAGQMTHTLSSICTLSNLPQYRLDPPRAGKQNALVMITAKSEDSFVVESVQFLNSDEVAEVKQSLLKLLHLAMHIHGRDRKRAVAWSDDFSPLTARKCSRVGGSPADVFLPDP